jgi:serine phosphatase RsbU (regulator of sigma subunit)
MATRGRGMPRKHPTILITDDAKVNRIVVKQCLQGHGYRFLEAENGQEALRTLQTHGVDLIILDLMMPIVDGFTFLEQLRADPRYAAIPVIVNSSLGDTNSIRKALTLGSYDYFIKALPREKLQILLPLKVRNAIQTKRLLDEICLKKGMLEKEIQAAGKYQRFLLPKNLTAPGMNIETFFHPYIGVGGDFFDFVPLQGDKTAIIIADVSGHGVLPAMVTAILKPLFRQYVRDTESPQETLGRLNADLLTLTDETDYITAFVAVYDPDQQTLCYANAGHPPPLYLRHATRALEVLRATGVFLGVFDGKEWVVEEKLLSIVPHSRLLLVTDGVSEARSETGAFLGIAGLEKVLWDVADLELKAAIQHVWRHLRKFTGGRFTDDITCIVIDFTGEKRE